MKNFPRVTLQALHNVGLNPFAVELLAESFVSHPKPESVRFCFIVKRDGKETPVYFRIDPINPYKKGE